MPSKLLPICFLVGLLTLRTPASLLANDVVAVAEKPAASTANSEEGAAKPEGSAAAPADNAVKPAAVTGTKPAASATTTAGDDHDDAEPKPGHSHINEAFNEGPRQTAELMPGTGNVAFAITSKVAGAQAFFNQGLGQLHGFWYFEAERSFRQVAKLDPACAMAYWGMALANVNNEKRAKGFVAEAVKLKETISERERMYVDALDSYYKDEKRSKKDRGRDYVKSLERILDKYPDDIEAKAFLALQIWTNSRADIPISSHMAVDALLDQVFAVNPQHPAHHYRIHLWDRERPERALRSAAVLGPSAPAIAHMWHMPGHTYSELKRYGDAAWQQEASARVDHAHMIRRGLLPDQIHNFAHNNEWLIRNLIHVGRVHDAVDLAKNMIELPQHPKYNSWKEQGSSLLGRQRLFEALAAFELWDELIALAHSDYLPATSVDREQIRRLRYLGRAFSNVGDLEQASGQLLLLQQRIAKQKAAMDKAVSDAAAKAKTEGKDEGKDEKQLKELGARTRRPFESKIKPLDEAASELSGRIAAAKGDYKSALAELEKGRVDKHEIARVQLLAGEKEAAEKTAREYVAANQNQVLPLAHLVSILWQLDKKEDAKKSMEELRRLASVSDLKHPAFDRLTPVVKHMELPPDWRLPLEPAADLGERPSLDALGPFRWQPARAADWKLIDSAGRSFTLQQYQGAPVVLIFFLGHDCLHCAEQLQAFAPVADEYAAAGISLVGISTDNQANLSQTLAAYQDGKFPFPLVANAELDVFKSYRVYDDFEQQPLHGVFLLDGDGLVRWHDISFEPFMDTKFLLSEAKRLLGQTKHAASQQVREATATPSGLSSTR